KGMAMIHRSPRHSRRRGAAGVEFAFLLPPILTLLVGIWEVGRLVGVQQLLTSAAREGGRQAAGGQRSNAEVKDVVTEYLNVAGVPTANVNVDVTNITSGKDCKSADYLDKIEVTVTLPFQDVRWSVLSIVGSDTFQPIFPRWVSLGPRRGLRLRLPPRRNCCNVFPPN